jgi:anti-sigma factor RsiW
MTETRLLELMHAVLDGEATADEARTLEIRVAADPAAQSQFARLERLFDGLKGIPQPFAPEGLVASVLAGVPEGAPRPVEGDQPFAPSRVIEQTSEESRARRPGRSARMEPVSQSRSYFRGENMSQQNSSIPSKRKMWIGGGVAAVAAVLLVSFGMDFPSGTADTAGTIVPAQRYRATQNMTDGVQSGTPAGTQSVQAIPATQNALAGQAEANAVNNATANATANAVNNATARAVDNASARAVDNASARAVDNASARAVDSATARAVDNASARAVDNASARAVDNASARAVDSATARAVDSATAHAVDNASARAVNSATAKAVDNATANATANAVNNATANAVNNATAKAVDSATARAVNNATVR